MKAAEDCNRKRNADAIFILSRREELLDIVPVIRGMFMKLSSTARPEQNASSHNHAHPYLGSAFALSGRTPPADTIALPARRPLTKAPPTDRIDHTELPTLQNLTNLPPSPALIALYFNSLQRDLSTIFKPDQTGTYVQMGPYDLSGENGRFNGVRYNDETGSNYGILRDPRGRFHLSLGDRIMPFAAGSPKQQKRAVEMLRQAAVTAYVSVGFRNQPRYRD
jgi:hypothetical protein